MADTPTNARPFPFVRTAYGVLVVAWCTCYAGFAYANHLRSRFIGPADR